MCCSSLERPHRLFPIGTLYVQLAVDGWPAAEAVHQALVPIARLDEAAWTIDWWRSSHGFREIKIFPDPAELEQAIRLFPKPDIGHYLDFEPCRPLGSSETWAFRFPG